MTVLKNKEKEVNSEAGITPEFKVIAGGLSYPIKNAKKTLVSAYVTDTRLMGVLVVYAHWQIQGVPDLHQFFYIDCEEYGLEAFKYHRGPAGKEVLLTEQALVGGLGAIKKSIDAKSLKWILQHWRDFNIAHALPLPERLDLYDFIFDENIIISPEEEALLVKKFCVEVKTDTQVINYFLMRCFGQDFEGAAYLSKGNLTFAPYDNYKQTTFLKNTIDISKKYGNNAICYICESLVETQGKHEIIISKVIVKDLKIVKLKYCDNLPLTFIEAALALKKPEYINVYEILLEYTELENNIGEFILTSNTIMSTYKNGRMFMAYKKTNAHVSERIFMLNNDVRGVYFLSDCGQLILMSNKQEDIALLEKRLLRGPLAPALKLSERLEFLEPVLFEYIESGIDDFDEFLDWIGY